MMSWAWLPALIALFFAVKLLGNDHEKLKRRVEALERLIATKAHDQEDDSR